MWVAEQQSPVVRNVALKVIKLGMDTKQVIARFEAERQVLAIMDHSNIARVFDAGATDAGRPYFVMELVTGEPITAYCDAQNLPIRQRLELFGQVCQAVQYAHTKGIVHRDLKPSNVLVSTQDDRPVAKVIDFGMSREHRQSRVVQQLAGSSAVRGGGSNSDVPTTIESTVVYRPGFNPNRTAAAMQGKVKTINSPLSATKCDSASRTTAAARTINVQTK